MVLFGRGTMPESQIEFAVQMTCNSCVEAIKKALADDPAIKSVDVDLDKGSVVVNTTLPTLKVQEKLECTGRKVVVRGYAGNSAGVVILDTGEKDIQGVIRFVQVTPDSCIVDGTVDGLEPETEHRLSVHECGDVSQGCNSVGNIFHNPTPQSTNSRLYGDLGSIPVSKEGRSIFKIEDNIIKLSDIIGRSLVISSGKNRVVCGIIARSAGLFQNPKTICACDGVTIWNEKVSPKSVL